MKYFKIKETPHQGPVRCYEASEEKIIWLAEETEGPWLDNEGVVTPTLEQAFDALGHDLQRFEYWEIADVYSIKEAADRLGMSRQRVHKLIVQGRIDAVMVGSTWVVESLDIKPPKKRGLKDER